VRPEIDTDVRAVRFDGVSGPVHQVVGIHDQGVTPGKPPDLRVQLILCLEPDLVHRGIRPDGQIGADGLPRVPYQEGMQCVLGQELPVGEGFGVAPMRGFLDEDLSCGGERAKLGDDLRRSSQRPAADIHIAEYREVRKRFVDGGEVTPFDHHAEERRRAAARRTPEHQH
jgi:hypothetical protein